MWAASLIDSFRVNDDGTAAIAAGEEIGGGGLVSESGATLARSAAFAVGQVADK
jgi:hypothetical protein